MPGKQAVAGRACCGTLLPREVTRTAAGLLAAQLEPAVCGSCLAICQVMRVARTRRPHPPPNSRAGIFYKVQLSRSAVRTRVMTFIEQCARGGVTRAAITIIIIVVLYYKVTDGDVLKHCSNCDSNRTGEHKC